MLLYTGEIDEEISLVAAALDNWSKLSDEEKFNALREAQFALAEVLNAYDLEPTNLFTGDYGEDE